MYKERALVGFIPKSFQKWALRLRSGQGGERHFLLELIRVRFSIPRFGEPRVPLFPGRIIFIQASLPE